MPTNISISALRLTYYGGAACDSLRRRTRSSQLPRGSRQCIRHAALWRRLCQQLDDLRLNGSRGSHRRVAPHHRAIAVNQELRAECSEGRTR